MTSNPKNLAVQEDAFGFAEQALVPRPRLSKDERIIRVTQEIMGAPPKGDEIAFLHATFCQVGLPRSDPKSRVFERRSGSAVLRLEAGVIYDGTNFIDQPLPYGTKPRLVLLHIIREYLRTRDTTVNVGRSLSAFLDMLGIDKSGGKNGGLTAFKQQMQAFAACQMIIGYHGEDNAIHTRPERLVEGFSFYAPPPGSGATKRTVSASTDDKITWPKTLTLSDAFASSIERASVPLDARAVRVLQDSALKIDVYSFLAHRLPRLERPLMLYWANVRSQFGQEFKDPRNFKKSIKDAVHDVLNVYPGAKVEAVHGGLLLKPSPPAVPYKTSVKRIK